MTTSVPAKDHVSGIASAPGDLPLSMLQDRSRSRATQFRHDNQLDPSDPRPGQPVTVTATSGAVIPLLRAEIWYTVDGSLPDASSARVPMALTDVEWNVDTRYLNHWQGTLPPQLAGTVVRYRIAGFTTTDAAIPTHFACDGSGFWYQYGEAGLTVFAYRVAEKPLLFPAWMDDAVIYHIILDRFHSGAADGDFPAGRGPQEKHGGTLRGVMVALPYLQDLGVNCLWLSPLGPSESYHRYDQRDFFAVDPDLGTLDDVRALVQAAHARGMRLILDFVPSHGSWEMPQFVAAQTDVNAPTRSWFVFDEWPHKYRSFLGVVPSLISFNGNDEGLRRFLAESACFWLCDVGFDGLRLDHSIGHGSDFWVAFSRAVEAAKPDAVLFGEATDTPQMLRNYRGQLQGILDFPFAQIVRMGFGSGDWGVAEVGGALAAYQRFMQSGPGRVTFIDNHDMNRFLFVARGDVRRLKLAALCLFTMPHPPALYYGTEIGLSQQQDKDAGGYGGDHEIRRDMPWDPAVWHHDLLGFHKTLIALRRQHKALRTGRWQLSFVDAVRQIFAYEINEDGQALQVIFNLSEDTQEISVGEQRILCSTTEDAALGAGTVLRLAALSGAVLESK
ncbi:MAG: alpha-amylase family glycosyl hydrolase [Caldilineaceae bacterium]